MSLGSGGAERVISLLLPELTKQYEVTLMLMLNDVHYSIPNGVKVKILREGKDLSRIQKIHQYLSIKNYYKKYLNKNPQDISLSFLSRPNLINASIKKGFPKMKVVLSERSFPSKNYQATRLSSFVFNILVPKYYNLADALFSNSRFINQDLKENFRINIPLSVIYNPVILPNNYKIYNHNLEEGISIITVGALKVDKNQILLLKAIAMLSNVQKTTIVGADGDHAGGHQSRMLMKFCQENNLNNCVNFTGKINNVEEVLFDHDCFVLTSNLEGFPNALLEALAVGLPCISTNCMSGPLEMLNDGYDVEIEGGGFVQAEYGLLINVDDAIGLKNALEFFNNNRQVMEEYGKKARKRASEYSVESTVTKIIDLLEN